MAVPGFWMQYDDDDFIDEPPPEPVLHIKITNIGHRDVFIEQ